MILAASSLLLVTTAVVGTPERADARTRQCNGQEATIVGTRGSDVIEGTDDADVIVTLGGDDVVFSGDGDDMVCTGKGDDVGFAGSGDDWVTLQSGDDFAYGGPGDDVILGGSGDDVIEGGPGSTLALGHNGNDELWGTWCTPPRTMQHYCRWPDIASYPDEYADLLEGTRTLRSGATGEDVRQLQTLLASLDYSPGPIDGVFGAATTTAVRAFQEASGLNADGVVGASTRAALQESAGIVDSPELPDDWVLGKAGVLKSGSRGEAVAVLQRTLTGLGYAPGPADGVFGSGTVAAIRSFQKANGLTVDGKAGVGVKRALFGDVGDPKELRGGKQYDTCNSGTRERGCEGLRGLRAGAPWDAAAAEEWRPLITEVFTDWDLEEEIDRAVAVAACEGLADPMIATPAGSGYYWIGLFQHTDRYWEARAARADIAGFGPFDPRSNVIVAALLVRESIDGEHSRGAWGHFGCGKLLGYWPSG
jgi:peptidoglycan hydrolase-like protein with peptidoglycan-binding domain